MSTFAQLVEDTLAEVSSYVKNQESITVLTQPATSSDLVLTVDDATAVSKGTVELGDELVYVKSMNKTSGTINIIPGGRGWKGTSAVAHDVHTILRNSPTFPRTQVKRAINDTIRGIDLMALSSFEFMFDGTRYAYTLPTDFEDVTGIAWNAPDTTEVWPIIRRYRIDRNYREGSSPVPRAALVLGEFPMPGRTVRVQYVKHPTALANPSDDFATVTGLPESSEDVIRLGAMWRLVSTVDPGKVVAMTPSADLVDSPVRSGDSTAVARFLFQLFGVRLAEERAKQQDNYFQIIQYAR